MNSRIFRSFLTRRDGNVAMVFGLSVIPFFVLAGMAIDIGRTVVVRERLGHAIDAAILAVGAAPELSQSQAQTFGEMFFDANFGDTLMGSSYNVSINVDDDFIDMSAQAIVPTTLLGIVGHSSFQVFQEAQAVRGGNDLELVMVLDNTGSMSGTKIASLRDAAERAVRVLFASGGTDPEAVKIGLVPFAATVNVGAGYERAWWMDADAQSSAHHHQHTWNADINRWDLFDELNVDWAGCVESRAEPYDLNDATPSLGNPNTLFAPFFAADAPGARHDGEWGYTNSESWLDDGLWTRAIDPDDEDLVEWIDDNFGGMLDDVIGDGLDPDLGLGEGEYYDSEDGARQAYIGKYFESDDVWGAGPNQGCIGQSVFPLSTNEEALIGEIEDMNASGNTNIPNGVAWGVRVLSPSAPYTEGRSYDTEELVKAMIVLTDGDNVMSGANNDNMSRYATYGYVAEGRFGITTSSSSALADRLDDKTDWVCQYAKDEGVRVYTITFQVSSSSTREMMEDCASTDEDGQPLYWDSPSNDQLEQVFLEIARDLVDLRLTK